MYLLAIQFDFNLYFMKGRKSEAGPSIFNSLIYSLGCQGCQSKAECQRPKYLTVLVAFQAVRWQETKINSRAQTWTQELNMVHWDPKQSFNH